MTVNVEMISLSVAPNVTVGSGGAARVQHTPVSVFLPALLSFHDKRSHEKTAEASLFSSEDSILSADACSQTLVPKGKATVLVAMEIARPPFQLLPVR